MCGEEYVESSSVHTKFGCTYDVRSEEVQSCDEVAIYLGMFTSCWGHCITDNIRRLWFLKSQQYKDKYEGCKLIYVPDGSFTVGDSFRSLLEILGFNPDNFIPITKPTRFKEIILPDESFYTIDGGTRYFTAEYADMIHAVREYGLKNFKKLDFDKVYFTYSHYGWKRPIGEYRLEQFFKRQGYKIIAPERFSFAEQLNILLNCKSFASTVGSCSHNVMFMNEGSQVILIPRAKYLTGYQLAVNEVTDLDIHWISSDLSIMANADGPWHGPFYFYVSRELRDFFHCNDDAFAFGRKDMHNFRLYLQLGAARKKDLTTHNFPFYYQKVLMNCMEEYRRRSILCRLKKKMKWVQARAKLEQKFHDLFNRI